MIDNDSRTSYPRACDGLKSSSFLSEEAIAARRAYKRKWNAKNKDKVRAAQARYWEKKALKKGDEKPDECQETNVG